MKQLLLLMISLSISQTISGQQINQSSNHYRNGDMLEKKQVSVEGFDLNGKNGENHGVGSPDCFLAQI